MNGFPKRWLVIWGAGLLAGALSHAGSVTLDGTVGPAGPLSGPNYSIPDPLGTTRGNNLFHSFGQFNLSQGDTANFTGPANIQNIIARVTGGSASSIDGTIDTTAMPNANFFFVNPFGVMFGPDAAINVSGAFTVTTADYVKLADGGRFDARTPANDVLTAAPISAFGFLGNTPGTIAAQSALTAADRSSVSLISGDINLDGARIAIASGRINLISVKSAGELALDVSDVNAPVDTGGFAELGAVTMANSANLDVSGDRAGRVVVNADSLSMQSLSEIDAIGFGAEDGLGVEITVRGLLSMDSGFINAFAFGLGNGAPVSLKAGSIDMENAATIATVSAPVDPTGSGNAGDITIQTGSLIMGFGANINATTASPASGGNIDITASTIQMGQFASLLGLTQQGPAGNIIIHTDSLTLTPNSAISTATFGPSPGGNIQITASSIQIDGKNQGQVPTGIFSSAPADFGPDTGPGGNITIHAGLLDVRNGAQISTSTQTSGDGGNIDIEAARLRLDGAASIQSLADATGKGGTVSLNVGGSVLIENGSFISTSAAQSDGGDINVIAGSGIRLINGQIAAQAAGNGGNVHLTTPSLVYLLDSQVTAQSVNGNGGDITIDPQFVILNNSQITANAIVGNGGNIDIITDFFLSSDSQVTASSEFGLQGSVTITAPDVDLSGSVVPLTTELLGAESLLRPECAVRLPGGISSFIVLGRGGVPVEPDALLPAFSVESEWNDQ